MELFWGVDAVWQAFSWKADLRPWRKVNGSVFHWVLNMGSWIFNRSFSVYIPYLRQRMDPLPSCERAFRPTLARRSGPPALQKHPRVGLDIVPWRATGLRRRVDTRVAWGVWQDGASLGDDQGQQ